MTLYHVTLMFKTEQVLTIPVLAENPFHAKRIIERIHPLATVLSVSEE